MLIAISLLVALVGLLMFALCVNPKLQRIGEIMFFCGLLAFLFQLPNAHFGLIAR